MQGMEENRRGKILSAYEALAESYDRLIDHKPHNAYYDRPNTLGLMPEVQGKSILDAACGPGKYAQVLLAQRAHVTGFDFSPSMVKLAQKRNKGAGTFFVHDLADPLHMVEDASFDIVLCALALHYLPDWTVTIQEFRRVLKQDGYLVISIEHPFTEYNYFQSTRYFEVEPVNCIWNGFGKPVEVHSYRRSLGASLAALTDNGFLLDKLLEPKPVPEFEKLDPKHFNELNAFPGFMCIRAVPRT
jgi:ubiquinone/menaquinone biosynthesis C-methylase UbiE